jgi:predicted nucleic-acid-binding protein
MIGIDTNILTRFILDDDPVWSPAAAKFINETLSAENIGFINIVTLAEFAWTVKKQANVDREGLALIIESFLQSDKIILGHADVVQKALDGFRTGNSGFADYLIAELNVASGAPLTMTIDKRAALNETFEQLAPGA